MTLAYIDHMDGLTARMLLGALIDIGLDAADIEAATAARTGLDVSLTIEHIYHGHTRACRTVIAVAGTPALGLSDLCAFYGKEERTAKDARKAQRTPRKSKALYNTPNVYSQAPRVVTRLFEAEAAARDIPVETLTLKDFDRPDEVVALIGVCEALAALRVARVYSAPLPLPDGLERTPPAVTALAAGRPVRYVRDANPVTSSGAALLSTLAEAFTPPPVFTLKAVGYGMETQAGIMRLSIGEMIEAENDTADEVVVIETNIDDMNPQFYSPLIDQLLSMGALDAYLTPIIMKKGRPATLLAALAEPPRVDAIIDTILAETTTIGVRMYRVERRKLARTIVNVDTRYGPVSLKVVRYNDRVRAAPEYEDCLRAAQAAGVPLRDVYDEARAAADRLDLDGLL